LRAESLELNLRSRIGLRYQSQDLRNQLKRALGIIIMAVVPRGRTKASLLFNIFLQIIHTKFN
jgi:hypothetical protein